MIEHFLTKLKDEEVVRLKTVAEVEAIEKSNQEMLQQRAAEKKAIEKSKQEMAQQRAAEEKTTADAKKAELDAVDKKFEDGLKYFFIAVGCAIALGIVLRVVYVQIKKRNINKKIELKKGT